MIRHKIRLQNGRIVMYVKFSNHLQEKVTLSDSTACMIIKIQCNGSNKYLLNTFEKVYVCILIIIKDVNNK